ncbi:MAG: ribose 5-phosphate isomerase B [Candidatus Hydrogenedentota bacterium]|nr:MAG: ribose 5-phosphate isomerase B [Candidatus Hydrogenedentota bacterium]
MRILIGSDHAGFSLKSELVRRLEERGFRVERFGAETGESVDYPPIGRAVAHALLAAAADSTEEVRGILICGSGIGMSISANRIPGIRAALCWSPELARLGREHNDANILVLPGRFLEPETAWTMVEIFLETPFAGGRHARRVRQLDENGEAEERERGWKTEARS